MSSAVLERPKRRAQRTRTEPTRTTMKAAAIDRFGPPSVLAIHELPVPKPGPHEVLIALHAAGVGVWDADIRGGWWPEGKPKFPLTLGTDGAGIVEAKGSGVRRFKEGDKVWAYEFINPKGGFYAEYVAVNAAHVAHVPRSLNLLDAGTAAVTGLTALQGIDDHLEVRNREIVLVFGASGADAVIDPTSANDLEKLYKLAPEGLDAVLALAGGDSLERCVDLMHPDGRVAWPNGVEPEPRRRPRIKFTAYNAEASPRHFTQLERAAEEADLQVPIAAAYPLAQAAKAHARLEKGHVLGRIALQIRK